MAAESDASLKERLKTSVVSYGFRQFTVILLTFGCNIILTRFLMPAEFGMVAVITIVINVAVLLADGGFGVYLIQRHREVTEQDLSLVTTIQLYASLGMAVLCFIGAAGATAFFPAQRLGWMVAAASVSLPLLMVRGMALLQLERSVRINKVVRVEVLEESVYAVTVIFFAAQGAGAWCVVIAQLCKAVTGCVSASIMGSFRFRRVSVVWDEELKQGFRFGFHYQAAQLITMARISIIPLYIIPVFGYQAGGFVERALFFCSAPLSVLLAVQKKTLFPFISRMQFDSKKIRSFIEDSIYISSVIDKFMFLPLLIFTREIIQKVFGEQWLPMLPLAQWVLVGNFIFGALSGTLFPVANGIGKSEYISRFNFASFVVSWVLSIPLTLFFGIQGVGIAAFVMWGGLEWLRRRIRKEVGSFTYYRQIAKPIAAALVTWLIIALIVKTTGVSHSIGGLVLGGIVVCLVYGTFLFAIDGKRLRSLLKRISGREQSVGI